MKHLVFKIILLFITSLYACKQSTGYFIGAWQIHYLVEHDQTIKLKDNWIHLKTNGTFESFDGNINKGESGKWMYRTKDNRLIIDGIDEKEDSEWHLTMKNDTLLFKSTSDDIYLISTKLK